MMIYMKSMRFSDVFKIGIVCIQKNSRFIFSDESNVKRQSNEQTELGNQNGVSLELDRFV